MYVPLLASSDSRGRRQRKPKIEHGVAMVVVELKL